MSPLVSSQFNEVHSPSTVLGEVGGASLDSPYQEAWKELNQVSQVIMGLVLLLLHYLHLLVDLSRHLYDAKLLWLCQSDRH